MSDAPTQRAKPAFPPVEEYRQILIWPLALAAGVETGFDHSISSAVAEQVRRLVSDDAGPWKRVADPLFHIRCELGEPAVCERQEPYAEFVYFHDFVQRFLYPASDEHDAGKSPLQILYRDDIGSLRITTSAGTAFELKVDRCNLYLFEMGVAVLAIEVSLEAASRKMDLRDAILIEDELRRVYAPYFHTEKSEYVAGQVLRSVEVFGTDGKALLFNSNPHSLSEALAHVESEREAPVFDHWKFLLGGLKLRGVRERVQPVRGDEVPIEWRHIVDERMPFLAYVRLPASHPISTIERGDWMRLCFADPPWSGAVSGTMPYDPGFLADFEQKHCYDRFLSAGTRHMFSGFSYVMVGSGGSSSFFADPLRHHFRHMYFQMALIAHLEFATCLTFSSRLSEAARKFGSAGQFADKVRQVHEEFLKFIHLFHFTGVSNQMQAREMFALWRRHLGLNELLVDVRDELATANSFHSARRAEMQAKEAGEQTDAANRLNQIAVLGLAAGLAFGFLGMNVMWEGTFVDGALKALGANHEDWWSRWLFGAGVVGVVSVGFLMLAKFLARAILGERASSVVRYLRYGILAGVVMFLLAGAALAHRKYLGPKPSPLEKSACVCEPNARCERPCVKP